MNARSADRIAQLLAEGHAHRLATQLAIHEAREQLAPLRSAVTFVGGVARLFRRGGAAGGVAGAVARFGAGHPWTASTLAMAAWRLLRRHPAAMFAAVAAGATAWWLLRPSPRMAEADRSDDGADVAPGSG
jgi:hypothetical protein